MCDSRKNDNKHKNKKGDEDMATTAEKLSELRKAMKAVNKDIPVLKSGKKGAIELDPKNPLHREWYEGR